jgi:hypothetical protein
MTVPKPAPSVALTPSEQILLAASAPPSEGRAAEGGALRIPADGVVHQALAAAILANEAAGFAVLEQGTRKQWFGLRTVPALWVRPTDRAPSAAWPAETLEARALRAAVALAPKQRHHAAEVTSELVPWDSNPEWEVASRARQPLKARGLVAETAETKTTLKIIKTTQRNDVLTPEGAALLASHGDGRALVEACARERADLWAMLWKAVTHTCAKKTRSDSSDSSDVGSSD